MKATKILIISLLSASLLIGCSIDNVNTDDEHENIGIDDSIDNNLGDSGSSDGDNISGAMPKGAHEAKAINAEDIKSIELIDIEGNQVKVYDSENFNQIVTYYNDSLIDDTAFIEMITGLQMIITFNNDETIRIHSYGSEDHVVASGDGFTYHLISTELAKILLSNEYIKFYKI